MLEPETCHIRRARPDDLAALPAIERAAAAQFRDSAYPAMADADLASEQINLADEQVWLAVDQHDRPIAFAIAHPLDACMYLHELDVAPEYARRGIGRRLIEKAADWARDNGYPALTLSTFRSVPWNAPYYARLGFRTLDETTLPPGLQAVRQAEAAAGLPVAERVCMRLDL
jgi:GNAT superfamily N-acetyltransferase